MRPKACAAPECDLVNMYPFVEYDERYDSYYLPTSKKKRGSTAIQELSFCFMCGAKLPQSRRDEWFDALEALGIDPWKDEIPAKFQTGEWRHECEQARITQEK
jgi:hypothetical protein